MSRVQSVMRDFDELQKIGDPGERASHFAEEAGQYARTLRQAADDLACGELEMDKLMARLREADDLSGPRRRRRHG